MFSAFRRVLSSKIHARWYAKPAKDTESGWPHTIYASERISDHKSVFLAHATTLPSVDLLHPFLDHLTSQPQLKRATHCMYAYRTFRQTSESHGRDSTSTHGQNTSAMQTVYSGQKDGGESGSGDRLGRLLEVTGCCDVVVVVSRWYGGVKLGNDRWKRINEVAKEALHRGGFLRTKEHLGPEARTTKKRKR